MLWSKTENEEGGSAHQQPDSDQESGQGRGGALGKAGRDRRRYEWDL